MAAPVEFNDNSDDVLRILAGATRKAAEMVGINVANAAKRLCSPRGPNGTPMKDGVELRNSIAHRVETDEAGAALMVGSNMQIAPYIELGTAREYDPPPEWMDYHGTDGHTKAGLSEWWYFDEAEEEFKIGRPIPPQPYLRPAFLDHVEDIRRIIQGELEAAEEQGT